MAVAKRQGREKPAKIEQRKVWGSEWGPQVEQIALLASPIYIGQAQGEGKKSIKRGAKGPGWGRGAVTLICPGAITYPVQELRAITQSVWELWHTEGFHVHCFKLLLRRDRTEENFTLLWHGPITSWQTDGETMETVRNFSFLDSKITADGDCSHEIKRCLLLGRPT